jgi:hypothetical protein
MMKPRRSLIAMLYFLLVQAMLLLCVKSGFGSCIAADASTMPTCEEIEECPDDLLKKTPSTYFLPGHYVASPTPLSNPLLSAGKSVYLHSFLLIMLPDPLPDG